jgi:hypothetical protein
MASPKSNDDANDYSRFNDIDDSDDSDDDAKTGIPAAERIQQMGAAKVKGNEHIAAKKFELASNQYRKGLKIFDDFNKSTPAPNPSEHLEAKELELSLHLNLSMSELKLEKWSSALKSTNKALTLDPNNVKALFRQGQANSKLGNLDESLKNYSLLLSIDSKNKLAIKEYNLIKKKIIENKAENKKGFSGLFDRAGGMYDDREQELLESKKRKAAEDAKLYKIYEKEMDEKEIEFNKTNNINNNDEDKMNDDNAMNDDNDQEKEDEKEKVKFARVDFEEWKKDRKKKEEEEEKRKESERQSKRDAEKLKKKQEQLKLQKSMSQDDKDKKDDEEEDDDLDEEDLKLMESIKKKGYCHFRRDQTEEEKEIIGNITPQKIDPSASSTSSSPSTTTSTTSKNSAFAPQRVNTNIIDGNKDTKSGGSAWNSGGTTWEETDCTDYGIKLMKKYLLQAKANSGNENIMDTPETVSKMIDSMDLKNMKNDETSQFAKLEELCGNLAKVSCKIVKVKKIDGDCSVAVVRGKKRYLFDMNAELEYEVSTVSYKIICFFILS